ncbi:MAG: nucleotidyltransferase family protein [Anaerolineales bacterium]|nr:nucleotidyltransferase family protein [Anaerolineales bacterium]
MITGEALSPETELILACARTAVDAATAERIDALLRQELDLRHVRWIARRNAVTALVFRNLWPRLPEAMRQGQLQQLRQHAQWTAFTNLMRSRTLLELLDLLQAEGIAAIPYKGPVLGQVAYQDVALRQFGDLDLIVPAEKALQARDVLLRHGFIQTWPEAALTPAQEAQHLQTKYNFTLARASDNLEVELHWAVTNRYINLPPRAGLLWSYLEPTALGGRMVPSFTPEVLLLILTAHGSNHCWNRLIWVCDVAETVRTFGARIDWERLLALAEAWHGQRMLLIGLHLAQTLLGAPLPAAVAQTARADKTAVALARQSRAKLLAVQHVPFRPLEEPFYHLRMLDDGRARWRYGAEVIRPSTKDWLYWPLPPRLAWLYYLVRPVRLIHEHGIQLLPWRVEVEDWSAQPAVEEEGAASGEP